MVPTSKRSAGFLLYRRRAASARGAGIEVLLAHPGGPFWAKKDDGAWSIPKGEIGADEDALSAARREFAEELGTAPPDGPLLALEPVRQAGGKLVLAWALEGDFDPRWMRSNLFEMEWPPRSGRKQQFPEVDRAQWFTLADARTKIVAGQAPLLEHLESRLAP